jgi:hypothetical protein
MVKEWVTNLAIVVILGMWAATMLADILVPGYDPPPAINALMMAVAGAIFGKKVLDKAYGPGEGQEAEKPKDRK